MDVKDRFHGVEKTLRTCIALALQKPTKTARLLLCTHTTRFYNGARGGDDKGLETSSKFQLSILQYS
jgi:hypothetical protein